METAAAAWLDRAAEGADGAPTAGRPAPRHAKLVLSFLGAVARKRKAAAVEGAWPTATLAVALTKLLQTPTFANVSSVKQQATHLLRLAEATDAATPKASARKSAAPESGTPGPKAKRPRTAPDA